MPDQGFERHRTHQGRSVGRRRLDRLRHRAGAPVWRQGG